ncbi:group I intron-associated PD-(D/E)XK endonuclease [Halolamina sp. C58]|uniref:group I intron-associated PD-(D/E)XK endonuclease n=1 Tax=Halolamina sp. C58 TaxID=3421640 RepID=UPI003EBD3420
MDDTELSPNRAGAVSEQVVAARLLRAGFNVSEPRVPCQYDVIVDLDGELTKTQIKRGFADSRPETLRVNMMGSIHDGGTSYESVTYDSAHVDAFAVHDPINEEVYWLWFDEAPTTELRRKYNSLLAHTIDRKL